MVAEGLGAEGERWTEQGWGAGELAADSKHRGNAGGEPAAEHSWVDEGRDA